MLTRLLWWVTRLLMLCALGTCHERPQREPPKFTNALDWLLITEGVSPFSGAEAPPLRAGVSAVSSLLWYAGCVLRHSPFGGSERFNSTLKTEHSGGLPAGNVVGVKCLASTDGSPFLCCAPTHLMVHTRQDFDSAGLLSCGQTRRLCRSGAAASP